MKTSLIVICVTVGRIASADTCSLPPLAQASVAGGEAFDKARTQLVLTAILEDRVDAIRPSSLPVSLEVVRLAERARQLVCAREAGVPVDVERVRSEIQAAARQALDDLDVAVAAPLPPPEVILRANASDREMSRANSLRIGAGVMLAGAAALGSLSAYGTWYANQPAGDFRFLALGPAIAGLVGTAALAGGATAMLVFAQRHAKKAHKLDVAFLPGPGFATASLRTVF
jgi:hypothetical protein